MPAKTVGDAFRQFASKITPTPSQRQTMSGRRERVDEALRAAFGRSNMPLVKTKLIGSAGRNTIIRPLDDVDVFAVFDDSAVWTQYQYDARKLLYRVRDALNTKYNVTVGSRGQAVRLFFTDKPHVEIVPAFAVNTGGYCIPSGGTNWFFGTGSWQMTNPYVHEAFLSKRHAGLGNRLKPLTRLIKRWNAVHGRHFASFHLELLVQATFGSIGTSYPINTHQFFEWAPQHLDVHDPAGYSGSMTKDVDFIRRLAMVNALKTAYQRTGRALDAEVRGNQAEAIRLWRITFGKEFSTYG